MLNVQVMSDLHLEFDDQFRGRAIKLADKYHGFVPAKTGADVLVLAGDIHVGTKGKQWLLDRLSEYKHVIYLAGNHEYYGGNFDQVNLELREMAKSLNDVGGGNFYFLNNDTVDIENVRFIGTTLWTDFFGKDYFVMKSVEQALNDFRIIKKTYISSKTGENKSRRLSTSDIYIENSIAKLFLEEQLAKDTDQVKFVITHHGPSRKSIHDDYNYGPNTGVGANINGGFVSDFDYLVKQSDVWVHGHTHKSFDYKIGNGRVICNPRGYIGYTDLNENFQDDLVVEV